MASNISERERRSEYIEGWYQTEKSLFRIAGVLLMFAVGAVFALDQPGDMYTATALAAGIAGSITLLGLNRRPRQDRTKLTFLREKQQRTRGYFAGGIALLLITQLGVRPLGFIVGGLFVLVALWYQWRAHKINEYTQLFATTSEGNSDE